MTGLFPPLPDETRLLFQKLPRLIDETFPIPGRFRPQLPRDVAELSGLLTFDRPERGSSYLGKPALLSAYLRYFMPWNIYRLSRLFGFLPLQLNPNDAVNDLGSGPLTLASALWTSRPDLRKIPLEFRCLDKTAAVLEAGKKFFASLTKTTDDPCPWTVRTIKGDVKKNGSLSVEIKGKPAALSAAVNIYNEIFWNFSPLDRGGLERFTENQARLLSSLTENSGSVFVAEPGIPRAGEFISLLRSSLLAKGRFPVSPCTHRGACPLPGISTNKRVKAKWCHFAFDTTDAPAELHKLSAAAGIPKERAAFSFILAGPAQQEAKPSSDKVKIRIISDCFPVGEKSWGRYGCSEPGLVLVTGNRKNLENMPHGTLAEFPLLKGEIDAKSGALLVKAT